MDQPDRQPDMQNHNGVPKAWVTRHIGYRKLRELCLFALTATAPNPAAVAALERLVNQHPATRSGADTSGLPTPITPAIYL